MDRRRSPPVAPTAVRTSRFPPQSAVPVSPSSPASGLPDRVLLSELLGALSHALDLTEGQPWGHAARTCLIGMRMAEALGLDPDTRSDLYYSLLMKDAGCSSNAHATATFFGSDDHEVKRNLKLADWTDPLRLKLFALRNAAAGQGLRARVRQIVRMARAEPGTGAELIRIRCDRGAEICRTLGFPGATVEAVRCLDEQWDGSGAPRGLEGEGIPLLSRIALLAQTLEVFAAREGWARALEVARERKARWFDPELVQALEGWADDPAWWAALYGGDTLGRLARVEPEERVVRVDAEGVDRVAEAFAAVVDAKTPFTARHSTRVAAVARTLAEGTGMNPEGVRDLYRAGLLHDIGKLGVTNRILDKNGPLTPAERNQVQRHPVQTLAIVGQVEVFAGIARLAAVHHERLDGTGYPWGYRAADLDHADRILAVADIYEALTAHRPYREGMPPERALGILDELAGKAVDPELVALARELAFAGAFPEPDARPEG
jgi:HD-GYP domain-containing protein (c-di-GMP phosphodiesterase class II)